MKMLIALLTLFSLNASAATQADDACGKFMMCGTYKGTFESNKEDGVLTTIEITSLGQNQIRLLYTLTKEGQEPGVWDLVVTFQDSGQMELTQNGHLYATGICSDFICSYAMHPFQGNESMIANSGLIRFIDGKLEFFRIWGTPIDNQRDLAVLTLQK